jgi:hypothetical protein
LGGIVLAGVLDIFVEYFANPMSWVFMGMFIMIGLLIGLFLRPWIGNQVIKFSVANHTFNDLDIDEETAISVQCKKKKGMPLQRFFKLHPGFTGIRGRFIKKPVTVYLGHEGTAYTWQIKSGKWLQLGSLGDALKTVWGSEFYDTIPERQVKMIEESRIQVTVGLDEAPLTPESMRPISEEDIKQEEDRQASKTFWEQHKGQMKGWIVNLILAGGTGFGIACLLMLIGLLKMPTNTVYVPQPGNGTAMILGILRGLLV